MCKDFSRENRPIWAARPRIPYVHKYPYWGYNEDDGTMKISLLHQVSHFIRGKNPDRI